MEKHTGKLISHSYSAESVSASLFFFPQENDSVYNSDFPEQQLCSVAWERKHRKHLPPHLYAGEKAELCILLFCFDNLVPGLSRVTREIWALGGVGVCGSCVICGIPSVRGYGIGSGAPVCFYWNSNETDKENTHLASATGRKPGGFFGRWCFEQEGFCPLAQNRVMCCGDTHLMSCHSALAVPDPCPQFPLPKQWDLLLSPLTVAWLHLNSKIH